MKGIVFDLDNTLYDRYATITAMIERSWDRVKPYINPGYDLKKACEHACRTEALYIDWHDWYDHLVDEHFFNAENIPDYEQFSHFGYIGFTSVAINFDGIHEFLDELKARGYKIAILTNCADIDYQQKKFDLLGISHHFDQIVISGQYATEMSGDPRNKDYIKPAPAIFLHMAKLLGEKPEDLYYVGDNPVNDVMGAINSGYRPIWVRSRSPWNIENKYMPELCVDNVMEILDIID